MPTLYEIPLKLTGVDAFRPKARAVPAGVERPETFTDQYYDNQESAQEIDTARFCASAVLSKMPFVGGAPTWAVYRVVALDLTASYVASAIVTGPTAVCRLSFIALEPTAT